MTRRNRRLLGRVSTTPLLVGITPLVEDILQFSIGRLVEITPLFGGIIIRRTGCTFSWFVVRHLPACRLYVTPLLAGLTPLFWTIALYLIVEVIVVYFEIGHRQLLCIIGPTLLTNCATILYRILM